MDKKEIDDEVTRFISNLDAVLDELLPNAFVHNFTFVDEISVDTEYVYVWEMIKDTATGKALIASQTLLAKEFDVLSKLYNRFESSGQYTEVSDHLFSAKELIEEELEKHYRYSKRHGATKWKKTYVANKCAWHYFKSTGLRPTFGNNADYDEENAEAKKYTGEFVKVFDTVMKRLNLSGDLGHYAQQAVKYVDEHFLKM